MNTRTTTPVVIASLALLLTGCAGAAVETPQGSSERAPAGAAHVTTEYSTQSLSGEALREFKGAEPRVAQRSWSDAVRRELKGSEPRVAERSWSDAVRRELKGSEPRVAERSWGDAVRRELKGSEPSGG